MIDLRTTVSARRYPALTFALGVLASIAIPTTAQYRESPAQPRASAGASTSWMAEAQENIRRKEYEATWQGESGVGGSSWQAPNRANNLRTSFTDEGIVVVPRTGSEPAWSWGLRLRGVAAAQATARGNRVEYVRGDVTEWYVNEERGLEQGFTIARPVPGLVDHDGRLRLSLEITGNTTARGAGQGAIEFQMQDGRTALRYDKLVVRDGEGRTLPSSMDLQGTTIVLRAEVGGASWPVVVDPLITSTADAQLESNQVSARFGISVSGAGDVNGDGYGDVIVGAYFYDNGQNDEGAAFVYHGSAGGVDATADAQLESNQVSAQFGISVSGAGDVNGDGYGDVIVGADFYDNGQSDEGAAFVYHGSAGGVDATADAQLESNQGSAHFGISVSGAGDVNGDGYGDVVVGAYFYDNGEI
ncbi:MAG TPA: integrin alpha, partial [Thermoanaerobaculia bacterium]|nr:integrin alpha [Thermoanaerobaculia bacterium]